MELYLTLLLFFSYISAKIQKLQWMPTSRSDALAGNI